MSHPPASGTTATLCFVGTGCSTGIPVIGHVGRTCACADAIANPRGYNARNNVSLLITIPPDAAGVDDGAVGGAQRHVLIDCGKTFRDAYFRVLAPRGVTRLDALLLTHDHADAVQGLPFIVPLQGDVRGGEVLSAVSVPNSKEPTAENVEVSSPRITTVPVFLMECTMNSIFSSQRELLAVCSHRGRALSGPEGEWSDAVQPPSSASSPHDGATMCASQPSSSLTIMDMYTLPADVPTLFFVPALGRSFSIYTVPVEHGKGYISLGFVFGDAVSFDVARRQESPQGCGSGSCVLYLSDVSEVPPLSMDFIRRLSRIDVLVIDCVGPPGFKSAPHFAWDEMWAFVLEVQPVRTYCVGMYCNVDHCGANDALRDLVRSAKAAGALADHVVSVEMAYDGQEVRLH